MQVCCMARRAPSCTSAPPKEAATICAAPLWTLASLSTSRMRRATLRCTVQPRLATLPSQGPFVSAMLMLQPATSTTARPRWWCASSFLCCRPWLCAQLCSFCTPFPRQRSCKAPICQGLQNSLLLVKVRARMNGTSSDGSVHAGNAKQCILCIFIKSLICGLKKCGLLCAAQDSS